MMRRVFIALLAVLLIASYIIFALFRPVPALTPTIAPQLQRRASDVKLAWPGQGAAAIGASGFGVLAIAGSSAARPTASTIKILTALCVLQKYPLQPNQQGPEITITQADVSSLNKFVAVDGSVLPVELGEQLSEYQALQALLLPSANNIAETLARWGFGSIASFNAYANQYAASLGMTATHVTDPSGFTPTTSSTPHDLVLLGEAALESPVLAQIMNQSSATLPVAGTVHNYNALLGQDGIIGIKTGNNDQDLGAYIFASHQTIQGKNLVVVGAVMGGSSLWSAMDSSLPLLRSAVSAFSVETDASTDTPTVTYRAPWGGQATAGVAHTVSRLIWSGSSTTVTVQAKKLSIPARNGEVIGTLTIHNSLLGDTALPLVINRNASEPSIWWKLLHPLR